MPRVGVTIPVPILGKESLHNLNIGAVSVEHLG